MRPLRDPDEAGCLHEPVVVLLPGVPETTESASLAHARLHPVGFSLGFLRICGNEQSDADRDAVGSFLSARGLHVQGEALVDAAGQGLTFDGRWSDLHLDAGEPMSGGIAHATLSDAESAFIYDLCVAAGFLIVNPQGDPLYLVPGANHVPDDVPDLDDTAWVNSPGEMQQALAGNFTAFRSWRERVISQHPDDQANA